MAAWRSIISLSYLTCAVVTVLIGVSPPAWSASQESAEEQKYRRTDPSLYAATRQYFRSDERAAPPKRIFRLTRDQIDRTVKSLLPRYFVRSIKEAMPRDPLQTNYEYAELLNLNDANGGSLAEWISQISAGVAKDASGVIACPSGPSNRDCLKAGAKSFVVRAFRGDVADAKLDNILDLYLAGVDTVGFNKATAELVEVILNSPAFLFRRETIANFSGRLTPAQMLEGLSYTIADGPPEAFGIESPRAADYLINPAEQAKLVDGLLQRPETREKLLRFVMSWLEVRETSEFEISSQIFKEFDSKLAAAMRSEVRQFVAAQLAKPNPKLSDLTQTTQSFVPQSLAAIYGPSAVSSTGGQLVQLDPAQRLGIFSQPAVIASHSGPTDSRPIKRGVFWVRKVMCMELEPPPKGIHAEIYELAGATERQRIEKSTSGPNCIGCHKVINPFAFFLESYDALGRFRAVDRGQPIDTSMMINFLDEEPTKTTTAVEALRTLTSSLMFKQCFVRQLFRFYMGRNEEPSDDPVLRRMFFEFAYKDEQDILGALRALVTSDRLEKRQ